MSPCNVAPRSSGRVAQAVCAMTAVMTTLVPMVAIQPEETFNEMPSTGFEAEENIRLWFPA